MPGIDFTKASGMRNDDDVCYDPDDDECGYTPKGPDGLV